MHILSNPTSEHLVVIEELQEEVDHVENFLHSCFDNEETMLGQLSNV